MAGRLGFEPRPAVLETDMLAITLSAYAVLQGFEPRLAESESDVLPLHYRTMVTGSLRVICAGFYSHGRIGHLRTFELPARVVGHPGIEPGTSDLSGLRANLLCQCPILRSYRKVLIKLQILSQECPSHLFATFCKHFSSM